MNSDEKDILEATAKGTVKAIIEYGEEKLKEFVRRFKNKEIGFIEDQETIDLIKELRNTPYMKLVRENVSDPDLIIQVEMGNALKRLEKDKEKRDNLIKKIRNKYGNAGLHVAEIVQCGILTEYFALLIGEVKNPEEFKEKVKALLLNVENFVIFVKSLDNEERIAEKIVTKIDAHTPNALILFSKGNEPMHKANQALIIAKAKCLNYIHQKKIDDTNAQQYDFLIKEGHPILSK